MSDQYDNEVLEKVAAANGHILDGTMQQRALGLAYCDAAMRLARETTCEHCDVIAEAIPAAGVRWVVQEHHELHCPKNDENTPGLHRDTRLYAPSWGGDDDAA